MNRRRHITALVLCPLLCIAPEAAALAVALVLVAVTEVHHVALTWQFLAAVAGFGAVKCFGDRVAYNGQPLAEFAYEAADQLGIWAWGEDDEEGEDR